MVMSHQPIEVNAVYNRSNKRASVFSGSRINGSRDMHAQLDFEYWEIFIP